MQKLYFENYTTSEVTQTRRIICTPSDYVRKHFFYTQEVGYLKSKKPHLSRREGLNSFLFIVVLSGSGEFTYNNTIYQAHANDCIFLDCQNPYSHISTPDDPWELLWMHFNGPEAKAYYQYFCNQSPWHFTQPDTSNFVAGLEKILSLQESHPDNSDILVANEIVNILTLACTHHDNNNIAHAVNPKLHAIIEYIDNHFTEQLTLDSLSAKFFISKYHMCREFKKEYGTTIVVYILTKRITYAKELLRYDNLPIEQIAVRAGIKDASYFNKVFRNLEGCTASEYRKLWLSE